jgi:type III secretory pathway component EscU
MRNNRSFNGYFAVRRIRSTKQILECKYAKSMIFFVFLGQCYTTLVLPQLSEKRSIEVIGYLLFVIGKEIYSIFIVLSAVRYEFLF